MRVSKMLQTGLLSVGMMVAGASLVWADSCWYSSSSKSTCSSQTKAAKQEAKSSNTIVDVASSAGSFNTLVAAVKAAGLVDTLMGDGPFTVFAPTDQAFANLPEGTVENLLKPENREQLVAVLTYHVVPGKVMAGDVVNLETAKTVQGQSVGIKVDDNHVQIDEARVIKTDIAASNGVIQ